MTAVALQLNRLCRWIDAFTDVTGRAVSWLSLALVLNTCVVVALRYLFSSGSIALQESMTYLHATLFMLGIAFTLKRGGHVRVDVCYRKFSARTQALVDVLGGLFFLLPVSLLVFLYCWDYVLGSWAIRETSSEGGGLPFIYGLKTLLLIMPVTVMIQGLGEILKNGLFLLGLGGSHTEERVEPI